jgi:phosphonate transport system substrate-binding protein
MTAVLQLGMQTTSAASYNLAVQPILNKAQTEAFYRPLAKYLSDTTGDQIQILASHNYISYWESMRNSNDFDLVLDAAHFTGYRVVNSRYQVLAKIQDTLSFSLITNENLLLFEPGELIGKPIASPASPSLAGVQLARMFPNQMRQPTLVSSKNFQDAMQRLKQGKAEAALVPTSMISGDTSVNTVTTTTPVPHLAFSASSRVDKRTQERLRTALLNAQRSAKGQAMLEKLNISGFEPASNEMYAPYARMLEGVWGY